MSHWCHDIPRDEAVRAAEEGRKGPLPTLADVIAQPFRNDTCQMCHGAGFVAERGTRGWFICDLCHGSGRAMIPKSVSASSAVEPENKGDSMATNGLRTERVTLEITYYNNGTFGWSPPGTWAWPEMLEHRTEYVRVVDTHAEEVAQSVAWEGARDAYRGRISRLTEERDAAIRERDALRTERITQALTADRFAAAVAEADTLRGRVAELDHNKSMSVVKEVGK